mmetsp:Transcript_8461/g.6307  ORF Transcript_8461/g.6307 Transcript_8461/m.6307 type:complete len:81 (-) Transcript_8461:282-524(-)
MYRSHMWQEYDIDLFFKYMDEEREVVHYEEFFDEIKRKRREFYEKDLVVDVRESWKQWAWRQMNFEDPPLIARDELPEEY